MKYKQYWIPAPLIIRLVTLIALTIAFLFSGCEVSKRSRHITTDTASVKRSAIITDQVKQEGAVKKEDNQSHEENDWSRLTMKWLEDNNHGDTTINNFITQPSTVIYERGKAIRDESKKSVDSSWYQHSMKFMAMLFDSLSRKVDNYEKVKHVKTKGLGWFYIVIIGLVIFKVISSTKKVVHSP